MEELTTEREQLLQLLLHHYQTHRDSWPLWTFSLGAWIPLGAPVFDVRYFSRQYVLERKGAAYGSIDYVLTWSAMDVGIVSSPRAVAPEALHPDIDPELFHYITHRFETVLPSYFKRFQDSWERGAFSKPPAVPEDESGEKPRRKSRRSESELLDDPYIPPYRLGGAFCKDIGLVGPNPSGKRRRLDLELLAKILAEAKSFTRHVASWDVPKDLRPLVRDVLLSEGLLSTERQDLMVEEERKEVGSSILRVYARAFAFPFLLPDELKLIERGAYPREKLHSLDDIAARIVTDRLPGLTPGSLQEIVR